MINNLAKKGRRLGARLAPIRLLSRFNMKISLFCNNAITAAFKLSASLQLFRLQQSSISYTTLFMSSTSSSAYLGKLRYVCVHRVKYRENCVIMNIAKESDRFHTNYKQT